MPSYQTFYYPMINLLIIQCWKNQGNALSNIPSGMCILRNINLSPTTLMLSKISPTVLSITIPSLQKLPSITLVFLLGLRLVSSINCIELLVWCYIFLDTSILRSSSLLIPLSLSLVISFLITLRLILMLRLLIKIHQLSNNFLQCPRLIKLNSILKL